MNVCKKPIELSCKSLNGNIPASTFLSEDPTWHGPDFRELFFYCEGGGASVCGGGTRNFRVRLGRTPSIVHVRWMFFHQGGPGFFGKANRGIAVSCGYDT